MGYNPDASKGFGQGAHDLAQDLMDMEMGLKVRKAFTRDEFLKLINNTYLEYYGKFKDQYNPDEYYSLIDDEDLLKRFSAFLEKSEDNILTA